MGPLIFEPYAIDLARRFSDLTEAEVLETAAGSGIGIATRALAHVITAIR